MFKFCRKSSLFFLLLLIYCLGKYNTFAQTSTSDEQKAIIHLTPEYQNAREMINRGEYESAINALQSLLTQPQFSAAAMIEIGMLRQKQAENEYSKAMMHFQEAARYLENVVKSTNISDSEKQRILYDLGKIYDEHLKDYEKAVNALAELVANYPQFISIDKAVYRLASCYEKIGDISEAAKWYKEIVDRYPYSTYFQIAQSKMKNLSPSKQFLKSAIETQERIVETATDELQSAKATLDLANMHMKAGNYRQAVEEYKKVINDSPNSELALEAYKSIITLLDEKSKDYKEAANAIEELVTKYPDLPELDKYLLRLGQIYEKDLETYKTRVVDGVVRYKKDKENIEKAIEYYNKVTEKYPDSDSAAEAYIRKGEIYLESLKDTQEAKRQFQEFLRKFPDHPQAASIRERIMKLDQE